MTSNLFGQPSNNDIKVGYIDPQLGYISNVTICEANEYAQKNPGTTFLFKNGNRVLQYLNINEVNNLTVLDLESNQDCEGINLKKRCGLPNIQFYGGDGIGAQGNPIIGNDGSILAVDLVRGGHGYQYPPQVSANDHCNYGAGAVLTAILGETAELYETYDDEDEFEEYQICDLNDVGFGRRYGPNGEDLGPWEPANYTKIGVDPIKQEIDEYERVVRLTERKPFWSTRKNKPSKITASDLRVTPTQAYEVTQGAWNEFMNSYAISPVSPSNVRGSDYAGILFTLEWNQEFPVNGEYIFRGLCDNIAQLYLDNEKIADLASFSSPVREIKRNISKGIHNIRVDLLNAPIIENIQVKQEDFIDVNFTVFGAGGKRVTEYQVSFTSDDGSHSFVVKGAYKNKQTRIDTIKVKPGVNYKVVGSHRSKKVEQGIIKNGTKNKEGGVGESSKIFVDGLGTNNDNDDMQITTNLGKFISSNKRKTKKSSGRTTFDLTFRVDSSKTTTSPSPLPSTSSSTASIKRTNVFNTIDYIDKADRNLWRINPSTGPDSNFLTQYGVSPFDTNSNLASLSPFAGTHRIRWQSIDFPVDGNYNIDIMVDDNVTLYIANSSTGGQIDDGSIKRDEIVIKKIGFSGPGKSTGKSTETRYFRAGSYRIIADLEQINGKSLSKGNPMALAISINVETVFAEVVSSKSWNENPMGVSLTIDAPEPTPPQELVPEQEGRCPNNPLWSTRFPNSSQSWYPVNYPGPRKITETITNFIPTAVTSGKYEVEFTVSSTAPFLSFIFTSVDGQDSFIIAGSAGKTYKEKKIKVNMLKNVNYIVRAKEYSKKYESVEQGLIVAGTKSTEFGNAGTSNKIFADYIGTSNDNDDIQIVASLGTFTSSNKRDVKKNGRNTYDLTYRLDAAPTVINTESTTTKTIDAPGWSKFMNRYAISPVKPLDIPGSDKSGSTYSTSWDIIIPYDGFYGVKGTADNNGKILIDNREVSTLDGFNVESPKLTKFFLTRGSHKITAEVYNEPVINTTTIEQKIFRTKDWQVAGNSSVTTSSSITPRFVQRNGKYFLEVIGTGSGEISFVMDVNDQNIYGLAATDIVIASDNGSVKLSRTISKGTNIRTYRYERDQTPAGYYLTRESIKNLGTFSAGKSYPIQIIGAYASTNPFAPRTTPPKISGNKLTLFDASGKDENIKLVITNIKNLEQTFTNSNGYYLTSGTTKDGVVYEGPILFHYNDIKWGGFMNDNSLSPFLPPLDSDNPAIVGTKRYTWKNVNFPESGQYKVAFQADNIGKLYIGGKLVLTTSDFIGVPVFQDVNVTSGTYDVSIEVENLSAPRTNIFTFNPTGFGLVINKNVTLRNSNDTPWSKNPMGISAILIPPPCPKKINGRGVVKKVDVIDPGNGYLTSSSPSTYPVSLRLREIIVENSGINYRGDEQMQILGGGGAGAPGAGGGTGAPGGGGAPDAAGAGVPGGGPGAGAPGAAGGTGAAPGPGSGSPGGQLLPTTSGGGAVLEPVFGPFGTITEVKILNPGFGFTEYPDITIPSETGINASFIPQFEVVRDPVVTDKAKLIQVTDLVGLKQNGYIDGRAYYGSVFYKNGVRYAGFYETPGDLVQVYDTLQESITARVTTRPTAIQRSGTDTELSSNNPKLNIPNTPENLI